MQDLIKTPPALASRTAAALAALLLLGALARAQATPDVRTLVTPIATAVGPTDDIERLPNGNLLLAQPGLSRLGELDPATGVFTPYPLPPLLSLGMGFAPNGDLYAGDAPNGRVVKVDLGAMTITPVASGFGAPADIVFDSPTSFYMVDFANGDAFTGTATIWHVVLNPTGPATSTPIVSGFLGASDIELGPNGTLYVTSLVSQFLAQLDIATGTFTPLASGIFQASDIIVLPDGNLLIATIFEGTVQHFDVTTGVSTRIAETFTSTGNGCEDMAFDALGNVYVTVNFGEVYKIDLRSPLRQVGAARVGRTIDLVLDQVGQGGDGYAFGAALSATTGIAIGSSILIPLDPDPFFYATLSPRPPQFIGFDGALDAAGAAVAHVAIPPIPSLAGVGVYFAAASFTPVVVLPITGVSNGLLVPILP
jgi:streptogramin lyase